MKTEEIDIADAKRMFGSGQWPPRDLLFELEDYDEPVYYEPPQLLSVPGVIVGSRKMRIPFHIKPEDTVLA